MQHSHLQHCAWKHRSRTYGEIVDIATYDPKDGSLKSIEIPKLIRNDAGWKQVLTPQSFAIARKKATEAPYSGHYNNFYKTGIYHCNSCGTALFSSKAKYDSETGWPSFTGPLAHRNLSIVWDNSWGLRRRAVQCVTGVIPIWDMSSTMALRH